MNFCTEKVELDIHGLLPGMIEGESVLTTEVALNWSAEPELRSWGIKSLYVAIKDQTFNVAVANEEGEEREIEFSINSDNLSTEFMDSIPLCPEILSFSDGSWTLQGSAQ